MKWRDKESLRSKFIRQFGNNIIKHNICGINEVGITAVSASVWCAATRIVNTSNALWEKFYRASGI